MTEIEALVLVDLLGAPDPVFYGYVRRGTLALRQILARSLLLRPPARPSPSPPFPPSQNGRKDPRHAQHAWQARAPRRRHGPDRPFGLRQAKVYHRHSRPVRVGGAGGPARDWGQLPCRRMTIDAKVQPSRSPDPPLPPFWCTGACRDSRTIMSPFRSARCPYCTSFPFPFPKRGTPRPTTWRTLTSQQPWLCFCFSAPFSLNTFL